MPDKSKNKKKTNTDIPRTVAPNNQPIRTSLSDLINPSEETLKKYNPDNAVRRFFMDYLSSPKYRERLEKMGYANVDNVIEDRKRRVEGVQILPQTDKKIGSAYFATENKVFMDNNQVSDLETTRDDILSHELGHAINSSVNVTFDPNYNLIENISNNSLNEQEERYIGERNKRVGLGKLGIAAENARKYNKTISHILSEVNHEYSPYENKSDMDSFRYMLKKEGIYDPGNQDFTPELLEKARKNKSIRNSFNSQRLFDHFSDRDLIDIMNKIAGSTDLNQPIAKNGGSINYKMKNSYQLAGNVQLPGFLGDLYNAGQNLGITNADIGLNALNYFGNLFAERQSDRENQAYQDYWRRQYQTPELAVNPFAFGDPDQMASGGRVKFKGPGFKFKGNVNSFMNFMLPINPLDTNQVVARTEAIWNQDDWNRLGFPVTNDLTGEYMKKGGIHIKKENRGKFTASAKRAGMGVQEFARHVLANPEDYSPTQRKRANFARNASKWKKEYGGIYADGGLTDDPTEQQRIQRILALSKQWGVPTSAIFSQTNRNTSAEPAAPGNYTSYWTFDPKGNVSNSVRDYGAVIGTTYFTPQDIELQRRNPGRGITTRRLNQADSTNVPILAQNFNTLTNQPEFIFGGPIPFGYKLDKKTFTLKKMYKGGIYKTGGEVVRTASEVDDEDANIEAEKGEYILGTGITQNPFVESSNIGVGLYKIDGKKHYEGGTKLRANPGDFIFSDDKSLAFSEVAVKDLMGKTVSKKLNRTPAKLAGTYNKLNDFIKESQDSKAMPLDRKTALLNVENIIDKLADIAIGQEAMKGFPSGIPQFAQVSIDKRSMPTMSGENSQEAASIPMAKYGGAVKSKYPDGGIAFPAIASLFGEPWKGDRTRDRKGVFQNPRDNRFPGDYQAFENRIQQAGFTGDINNNREIQRFLYGNLMQTPEGRNQLGQMWNQYGITNYGMNQLSRMTPADFDAAGLGEVQNGIPQANFDLTALSDPNSIESNRLLNWGAFYDDNMIGVRTRMLGDSLTPTNPVTPGVRPPITGFSNPGLPTDPMAPVIPGTPLVQPPYVPPTNPNSPPISRNYNTPVNMNIAELYGLLAANRRFQPRYPTAQRFYEGENIDATLNAGFQPTSAQPILNNIQRQMNVFNQNNSGMGPISYARNSYAFTQALNAQNSAIAQNQLQNVQRRDQLTQSLVQNQALKGQYRLQLQDKYLRELEMLNNNREQAAKNRMAQTSNLLNAFVNRAYTQRYSNAMMDNFEIDPNGNLRPRTDIDLRRALMNESSGNQMNTQLRYAEQLFKLMQQYGIKSSGFVDNILKGK